MKTPKIHKLTIDKRTVFISQNRSNPDNFKVVKPWKNEDGTINWFNFLTGGGWKNVIGVIIIVVIILGIIYEYTTNIQHLLDCFEIPGRLNDCLEAFGPGGQMIIYP